MHAFSADLLFEVAVWLAHGVGIADVLYEAVESFIAKCEAEADLEKKVIKFPTVVQRS
jgi:hypothetical protein